MSSSQLLAFAAMSLLVLAIPGPAILYVVGNALAHGRRVALSSVAGVALGTFAVACLVALGLGAIVQASATVFNIVKFAGAFYLVYLGVKTLRQASQTQSAGDEPAPAASLRGSFGQGFVVGITNPKTTMFFAAALPQFIDPAAGAVPQMILLGGIFAIMALACDSLWGIAASAVHQRLARSWRRARTMRRVGGTAMIGLGVSLACAGQGKP